MGTGKYAQRATFARGVSKKKLLIKTEIQFILTSSLHLRANVDFK